MMVRYASILVSLSVTTAQWQPLDHPPPRPLPRLPPPPPPPVDMTRTRSLSLELRGGDAGGDGHPSQQHPQAVQQIKSRMKEVEYLVQSPIIGPGSLSRRQGEAGLAANVRDKRHHQHEQQQQNKLHRQDQGAAQVREIRLQWSDKIESSGSKHKKKNERLENYQDDEKMMMKEKHKMMNDEKLKMKNRYNAVDDRRDKRFLDPDEISMGGVTELGSVNGNETEIPENIDVEEEDLGPQDSDPNNDGQQFCVDISEYLDLKWVLKDAEECHVNFNR